MAGVRDAGPRDITGLLVAWNEGDQGALNRLVDLVYPSVRRIAREYLRGRKAGESLESAALANETYLKLVRAGGVRCRNRAHFLALCAQMMRRILVDHARRRRYAKRGGTALHVTLEEAVQTAKSRGVELLALDEALDALARIDRRKQRVVELRYFGGLEIEETAEVLGVSADTVKRDWRMARAWLLAELSGRQDSARVEARTIQQSPKSHGGSATSGKARGRFHGDAHR
jgi:RNA polymerase sigma factor (TIGR02999 family)